MLYVAGEVRLAGVWEALLPSIPPWLTWIIFAWCSAQEFELKRDTNRLVSRETPSTRKSTSHRSTHHGL
ncbi:hypothetical protein HYQ44_011708 [Verticillium longisporum]|nr:hypothetical protein HYQ44_011708 [Verticillium longisporum]